MLLNDLFLIAPELLLVVGLMVLLLLGVFRGDSSFGTLNVLSQLLLLVAIAAIWWTAPAEPTALFNGLYVRDAWSDTLKTLILFASLASVFLFEGFARRESMARFELPILILFATLGMMVMVSANDMMTLYVGLELQSLALYVLASFQRDKLRVTEAGLKYFILGALSSGILLFGISLLYGYTGTTLFAQMSTNPGFHSLEGGSRIGIAFGMVFVLAGLAFKVSAVPFHMWTPDVYEGAPTPVTAFFSMGPKIAAMGLLVRVLVEPFGGAVAQWQLIVILLAVGSMVLGSVVAVAQTNIKRLMAYSSIGHMGFALTGLVAANHEGIRALLVYLLIYLVMNVGTFAAILSMRRDEMMVEDIADLRGFARTEPLRAMLLAVLMFSLAGIPPLAGFFAKLFVFQAAVQAGFAWLAVLGVLASCVAAFYYLRIVKYVYFDEAEQHLKLPRDRALYFWLGSGAGLVVVFLLFVSFSVERMGAVVQTIL